MTIASLILVTALPAAASDGGRAALGDVSGLAATGPGQAASSSVKTTEPPADRTPEVNYWHRHALYNAKKRDQWKRAYKRLRARVGRSSHSAASGGAGSPASVRDVICSVFGAHCSEALRVAWCESRFNVYARNGQYLGLFQMGSYARGRYGHSWTAYGQARAAYRYFLDAGWSPWACRP